MDGSAQGEAPFQLPAGLTAPQREAISAPDRFTLVVAGAGSGKTRVLTLRIAQRVHNEQLDPQQIVACTFSRKAAGELTRRLDGLKVHGIRTGTFHRLALSLLCRFQADQHLAAPRLLLDRRLLLVRLLENPDGMGRRASARLDAVARAAHWRQATELDAEISWAKARRVHADDYEAAADAGARRTVTSHQEIAAAFTSFERARTARQLHDLDDLLIESADLLHQHRRFAEMAHWRFRHFFVDEVQDMNPAQFHLLSGLMSEGADLFCVGDPRQAIYGWNGADPGLIDQIAQQFAPMRRIELNENHRSSPQVVAAARAVFEDEFEPTSHRPDGPIPTITECESEAAEAAHVAREIYRSHRPGQRWSQIAVLARTNAQLDAVAAALEIQHIPFRMPQFDAGPATDVPGADPDQLAPPAEEEAQQMFVLASEIDEPDLPTSPREPRRDGVVLTTLHRAKGLQWSSVFIIGVSEGLLPIVHATTPEDIEEERRLLYVGLTRAEDDLTCTWARHDARGRPRQASRWLASVQTAIESMSSAERTPLSAETTKALAELRATLAQRKPAPTG